MLEQPNQDATTPIARPRWQIVFWIGLGLLLSLLLAIALWRWWEPLTQFLALIEDQETVATYLQSFGLWGPVVLALAQMLQVLIAFIPGHVFVIAAGYVYGFPLGLLFNLTFTVAASQLCFLLARWAGRPLVHRFVNPQVVARWEKISKEKGFVFFTISFWLPVFPSDAMNFVAGLSGISSRRFLAANIIGRLPSAIMLTLIGSHGLELSAGAWSVIALIIVATFILGRFLVSKLQKGLPRQSMITTPVE